MINYSSTGAGFLPSTATSIEWIQAFYLVQHSSVKMLWMIRFFKDDQIATKWFVSIYFTSSDLIGFFVIYPFPFVDGLVFPYGRFTRFPDPPVPLTPKPPHGQDPSKDREVDFRPVGWVKPRKERQPFVGKYRLVAYCWWKKSCTTWDV